MYGYVELIGALAAVFAVLLNLAMILQIKDMWDNQSHEGINPIMIFFMFLNSLFWAIYGFLKLDINIIIPNFLGTVFTPIVLFLIVYFANKKYIAKKMAKMMIEKEHEKHEK